MLCEIALNMKKTLLCIYFLLLAVEGQSMTRSSLEHVVVSSDLMIYGVVTESIVHEYTVDTVGLSLHPNPAIAAQTRRLKYKGNRIVTNIKVRLIEVLGGEYEEDSIEVIYYGGKTDSVSQSDAHGPPLEFSPGDTVVFPLTYALDGYSDWHLQWYESALYQKNGKLIPYRRELSQDVEDPLALLRDVGKIRNIDHLCEISEVVVVGDIVEWTDFLLTLRLTQTLKGNHVPEVIEILTTLSPTDVEPGMEILTFLKRKNERYEFSAWHNSVYYCFKGVFFRFGRAPIVSDVSSISKICESH